MFFANDKHRGVAQMRFGNFNFMIIAKDWVIHTSTFWSAALISAFVITLNARND